MRSRARRSPTCAPTSATSTRCSPVWCASRSSSQLTSRFSAEFGQYQFVQSVVPQVAYATLSRRDRRAIHLAVATQTEAVSDPAGDLAPIIAQHYLSAVQALPNEPDAPELKVRAGAQLERAAARARSLGALSDSANHLLLALGLTEDPGTRARLDTLVAWALVDSGDYERAVPHAVAAVDAFDAAGDPVTAGLAAAAHGNALALSGDNAGALSVVEPRWEALVDRPGADEALLPLAKVIGTVLRVGGPARRAGPPAPDSRTDRRPRAPRRRPEQPRPLLHGKGCRRDGMHRAAGRGRHRACGAPSRGAGQVPLEPQLRLHRLRPRQGDAGARGKRSKPPSWPASP